MDDLISRREAIDVLKEAYWDRNIQAAKDDPCIVDAMTDWAIRKIKGLPSAQPTTEPYWTELMVICDNCGHAIHVKRMDRHIKDKSADTEKSK